MTNQIKCECGSWMMLRTARRGYNAGNKFWGCASYPRCKKTQDYFTQEDIEAAEQRVYDAYEARATMTYGDYIMELYENAPYQDW